MRDKDVAAGERNVAASAIGNFIGIADQNRELRIVACCIEYETIRVPILGKLELRYLVGHDNGVLGRISFVYESAAPLNIGDRFTIAIGDLRVVHLIARSRMKFVSAVDRCVVDKRLLECLCIGVENTEVVVDRRRNADETAVGYIDMTDLKNGVLARIGRELNVAERDQTARQREGVADRIVLHRIAVARVDNKLGIRAEREVSRIAYGAVGKVGRTGMVEPDFGVFKREIRARERSVRSKRHVCTTVCSTQPVDHEFGAGRSRDTRSDKNVVLSGRIVFTTLALAVIDREGRPSAEDQIPRADKFTDSLTQITIECNGAALLDLEIVRLAETVFLTNRNDGAVLNVRRARVIVIAAVDANVSTRVNNVAATRNIGRKFAAVAVSRKPQTSTGIGVLQIDLSDAISHVNDIFISVVIEAAVATAIELGDKIVGRPVSVGILVVILTRAAERNVRLET